MPPKPKNIIGNVYNMLTVLEYIKETKKYKCMCDCGNITYTQKWDLLRKDKRQKKSCGCLTYSNPLRNKHKHEYISWQHLKDRCNNENNHAWKDYGGRGITVCDAWKDSFTAFFEDMGTKPSPKHSIDRIDVDKGYYKENCRWTTMKVQQNNKSNNALIEYNGKTQSLSLWCEELNLVYQTIYGQLSRGYTVEQAFTKQVYKSNDVEYNGKTQSISAWSRELGFNTRTLSHRLERGWTIERAFTTPIRSNQK